MKFFIFACIILTGCAAPQKKSPNRSVRERPQVILPALNQLMLVDIWQFVEKTLSTKVDPEFKLEFVNFWLQHPCTDDPTEMCMGDGFTDFNKKKIYILAWQPCLADSALIHEMIHAIKGYGRHTFQIEILIETVWEEAVTNFCPEGYVRPNPPPPDAMFHAHPIDRKSNGTP